MPRKVRVVHAAYVAQEFIDESWFGRGMIESVRHKKTAGGPDLAYRRYWRDSRDRIEAWKRGTDNSQNWMEDGRGDRYRYDPEGQLIEASYRVANPESSPGPAVRADVFTYDELGNRVRWNHLASLGWMDLKRRDNGLNQYREWENNIPAPDPNHWGSGIFHDDNIPPNPSPPLHPFVPPGNGVLMQDGWITAGFNALNQPTAIWSFAYWNTPNWMFFGYDPLGRRVKQWVGPHGPSTNPTYYYYDGWNLIQEGSSATSAARLYVHGGRVDEIVASQSGGSWVYHHYDARGHCILLTNPSGTITEQYDYDAFGRPYFYSSTGQPLNSSTFGNRFLFTGREWIKDLKLYDYRNRMYQPELGRFLQPDPKQFEAGDYNLYRYCHNDPVNKSDPLGLDTAVAIGGARWDQWTDIPNPLGHASLALTGQGTFSFGTGTPQGSSFTGFLTGQAAHRFTVVYILRTDETQEGAMKQNLEASAQKGALPNIFTDPAAAHNDNCATRTADALRAGNQDVGHPKTPAQLQHKLEQKVRDGTATRVFVPQSDKPSIQTPLKDFDKK